LQKYARLALGDYYSDTDYNNSNRAIRQDGRDLETAELEAAELSTTGTSIKLTYYGSIPGHVASQRDARVSSNAEKPREMPSIMWYSHPNIYSLRRTLGLNR